MNLKFLSLLISIIGISTLLSLASFLPPESAFSYSDLKENSYMKTEGKVISERTYNPLSVIQLDNNITITCNNCPKFINKTVEVEGKVVSYESILQILAYNIKEK